MARIRSIHPGLFTDPEFADLSERAQVFYLGLLCEADDNGIFEWKPTTLRIRYRPTKDGAVDPLLAELIAANKVAAYEIEGRKYGAIRKFTAWQRPKSPKSWHPIPDHFRNYIGSSGSISEIVPQREEVGGKGKPLQGLPVTEPSCPMAARESAEGARTHDTASIIAKIAPSNRRAV